MTKKKKLPPILRHYKAAIIYTCPIRGKITEIREIPVYGTGEDWMDRPDVITLDDLTND